MFALRKHTEWSFVQFFAVIVHTVLLYMLAAPILPDFDGEERVDLHRLSFEQARGNRAVTRNERFHKTIAPTGFVLYSGLPFAALKQV